MIFNDIKWKDTTGDQDVWNAIPFPCYHPENFPYLLGSKASNDLLFIVNTLTTEQIPLVSIKKKH